MLVGQKFSGKKQKKVFGKKNPYKCVSGTQNERKKIDFEEKFPAIQVAHIIWYIQILLNKNPESKPIVIYTDNIIIFFLFMIFILNRFGPSIKEKYYVIKIHSGQN